MAWSMGSMGSTFSWHCFGIEVELEVQLRRLESSRSWFRITWRKKTSEPQVMEGGA
jgi:hypothetical protein